MTRTRTGGRRARAVLACAAALGALVTPAVGAEAASISYIGADGNAYLAAPDGSRTVQLTSDATPTSRYRMAGQADDGQIVVHREKHFSWLNPDGTRATGPWRFAEPGSGGLGPLNAQVAPGGTLVAVDWNSGSATTPGTWRVVKMPRGPHVDQCTFGCVPSAVRPRWVPGAEIGFISENLSTVSVQMPGVAAPQEWFSVQDHLVSSFDVSRTGPILIEAFPDTGVSPPKSLALLQNNGLPPATPSLVCELPDFSQAGGFPRWSPDGTQIAWEDPAGVQVSPAPVNQNGTCVLSPRLLAPGGRSPDWGVRDVPPAPAPPGPPGPPAPRPPGPPKPPFIPPIPCCVERTGSLALKLSGRVPRLGMALRRGVTFALDVPRAGRVTMTLATGARSARAAGRRAAVVARGSATARRAGAVRVTVRFTRQGRRRLRTARRVSLTARATFAGGTVRSTAARRLVLRR